MKSVLNMTGLFAGMILGVLFLRPLSADGAGDPAKGKAIYEKHCMACHGPQGKGDGSTGKMLKPPAADFSSAVSRKKSDAEFREAIENGKPGTAMGPWKSQLSPTDLNDVFAYVTTLRK
ncbi:MAG: cytochrome c [Nitrospiraceae bacterium]